MKGLSKREVEIISWLELNQKYFFSSDEIRRFVKDTTQLYNVVKGLIGKGRILKINRSRYYLIPIKAVSGSWSEDPYIISDEIFDGKDYFIGGWAAANYWKLTDQIPMQFDIWTTKRQGKLKIFNVRFVFHRTTRKRVEEAVSENKGQHGFRIMDKERVGAWLRSRE
jgi:predicted transcriptional regulator of viral defense system